MSNRPNRKPSRSLPSNTATTATRVSTRVAVIVGGVILALLLATIVWVVARAGSGEPTLDADATRGKQVAINKGCVSCHSSGGGVSEGPTWKGLYGQPVTLTDGSVVTVDDGYLTRAIREPGSQIVQGYKPTMPTKPVSDDELTALLAYLRALR